MTASATPSYCMQVKAIVSPALTHYRVDLIVLDRKMLRGYTGEFVHCSRDTGTDLALVSAIDSLDSLERNSIFCLRASNTVILHGLNGVVKSITLDKARAIFDRHEKRIENEIQKTIAA